MKRIRPLIVWPAIFTLSVVLALCACQPTPDTSPVINKRDGRLEDIIASSAVSPMPGGSASRIAEAVGAPDTFNDSYTNAKGDVTVIIDAKVETPSVKTLPVVLVKIPEFTQEQADKFGEYFLKDAPLFTEEGGWTKAEMEESIIKEEQYLQELKKQFTGTRDEDIKEEESFIEKLKREYAQAPEERKILPATLQFISDENGTHLSVLADLGKDGKASFSIGNSYFEFDNDGKGAYSDIPEKQKEAPRGMITTLEEAKGIAAQCLLDLKVENMQIESVRVATYYTDDNSYNDKEYQASAKQCYAFSFTRTFYGIPVNNIESSTPLSSDDPNAPAPEEPDYSLVSDPESMEILVDDTGIVRFRWTDPSQEAGVLSEHVTLMLFEEVVKRAKDNIFFKNYTAYGSSSEIKITSIKLSMMRIVRKDKPGEYLVVPVWDFIGNSTSGLAGHENWLPFGDQSYVTINAIDGSMIRRDWGY